MSVATLLNIPRDDRSRHEWTFANADSHFLIINAIATQYSKNLDSFVLDPLPQLDIQNFLLRHQAMHNAYEEILGIEGDDYTAINFSDPGAVEFVWRQHANSHIQAHAKLRIS